MRLALIKSPFGLSLSKPCASVGLGLLLAVLAHSSSTAGEAPAFALDDPERVEAGRVRFGSTCAAYCHGTEGRGGRAPSFIGREDFDPAWAFRVIRSGQRGRAGVMPPFANLSHEQTWELVAYLQQLAQRTDRP